jgi:hypothetical protein
MAERGSGGEAKHGAGARTSSDRGVRPNTERGFLKDFLRSQGVRYNGRVSNGEVNEV